MSSLGFVVRSLRYYWRTHLAVLLGVVAGTAVLTGALVVGDSMRGSLRDLTLKRLGRVDHALTGPRFFRESLAEELAALPAFRERFSVAAPALMFAASAEYRPSGESSAGENQAIARAGGLNLVGLDERLWSCFETTEPVPAGEQIVLSRNVAEQLQCSAGDPLLLTVELPSALPRDSLLGKRDETAITIPVTIGTILAADIAPERFGLQPSQQLPLNAFVPLSLLQDRLGLAAQRRSRQHPQPSPARVNALFISAKEASDGSGATARQAAADLTALLPEVWQLADFDLRIVENSKRGSLSLESRRMLLEPAAVQAARQVASQLKLPSSPVLVSLVNEITAGKGDQAYTMYSIVAGLDPELFRPDAGPPFGPFEFVGPRLETPLAEGGGATDSLGEILLNDWAAADLQAKVGDTIRLRYHPVDSHGERPELEQRFRLRGIVKLDGTVAADAGLTPQVPGITDVDSLADWDQPFPMQMDKITTRDEQYWKKYHATPKAFVSLNTAQKLWGSRFGNLTSFRFAPADGHSLADARTRVTAALLHALQPGEVGLVVQPVKRQGLQAAAGTTDFSGLFIGFSLFIIASAIVLIGLLFRLGIERRASAVGVLLATGFTHRQVRRLAWAEAGVVVVLGSLLGIAAAIAYAGLMVHGLRTWWVGAVGTPFVDLHVRPLTLVLGAVLGGVVGMLAVAGGLRQFKKIPVRSLLAGASVPPDSLLARQARRRGALWTGLICLLVAVVTTVLVISGVVPQQEAFSGFSWPTVLFFLVGLSLLVAVPSLFAASLDADQAVAVRGRGLTGLARLGIRNAARNRGRSVLSVAMIASATFLIVAIAAGHRNPAVEQPDKQSGNGGFTLVAESSVPVLADLNTEQGRRDAGLLEETKGTALQPVAEIVSFRVNPGENASCLNLYQTRQPTILGVPPEMIARGGFKFVGAKEENPWTLLDAAAEEEAIPVFGDMNTLMYSLHVGPGAVIEIQDEDQRPVKVRIAGMLDSSIFQGVLLMADRQFRRLYPSRSGSRYFLIDVPPAAARQAGEVFESRLPGFDVDLVSERLAGFLAVQNTYLSTFQALGGLGLLLGTIGLATVMLRNILERRAELALFRAVGFRNHSLASLVLCENGLLLVWGLAGGAIAAVIAMLPHLLSTGADVPWWSTAWLLLLVFVVGMLAAWLAVREALRTPVLATLRSESIT